MTVSGLRLHILDASFDLVSNDARWIDLLGELWRPFVSDVQAPTHFELTIAALDDGWRYDLQGLEEALETEPWQFADKLRHCLTERALMSSPRFIGLHAAVVVRGEGALVLAGRSGTGKTTLTLGLVRRGWRYFSDDVAPLQGSSSVVSFPGPPNLKVAGSWPDSVWEAPAWTRVPGGRLLVPPVGDRTKARATASPRWLLFPRYAPAEEAGMSELSPAESLVQLGPLVRNFAPDLLEPLGTLTRRVRSARVSYGSTDQALVLLEDWLG